MKQYEAVILTIERLGGVATLGELNHEVFKIEDCEWKTKTPFASIRRIVQQNKEIYKIKPGLYGLMKYKKENESNGFIEETEKNKDSEEMIKIASEKKIKPEKSNAKQRVKNAKEANITRIKAKD